MAREPIIVMPILPLLHLSESTRCLIIFVLRLGSAEKKKKTKTKTEEKNCNSSQFSMFRQNSFVGCC